jgi:hypothetical protein
VDIGTGRVSHQLRRCCPTAYTPGGAFWDALVDGFAPEEQARLQRTVLDAVHEQRRALLDRDG